MSTRHRLFLRPGAAILAAALVAAGCSDGRNTTLDPEVRYTGGAPLVLPGPGDGSVAYETFEVCKHGSDGDFDYTVTDRVSGGVVRRGTVTIADGTCTVLALSGGFGQYVTVTEVPRAGYRINRVEVTSITTGGVLTTWTVPGPTVSDSIGGSPMGLRGIVARYYNEPIPTFTIGNFVWSDLNNNGVQDAGEPGLANIGVALSGDATATTTTDVNGYYAFTGLYDGDYVVTVGTPAGYAPSPTGQGTPSTDSNGSPAAVTIAGADDLTVDFGFHLAPPSGGQGCTPGYWKQPHHFDSWPSPYSPTQPFASVFANAFPGKTLVQVLSLGGGGLNALGRHTVAALLNAGSAGVDYDLATAAVINAFNAAFASGNYEAQKNIFAAFNEQGCPLN